MKKEEYYDQQHKRNLKSFKELSAKILKGLLKIIDIRVDEPQFGHTRITIFVHGGRRSDGR